MTISEYATKNISELFHIFCTSEKGLSTHEASQRLAQYGANILGARDIAWWDILVRQCKSAFFYLLAAAAILSLLLHQTTDGVMIFLFIIINTLLGFFQEYRSHHAAAALKKYIAPQSRVIREGEEYLIASSDIVPGDLLAISAADAITADIRLIEDNNLMIDESSLSGESLPVQKTARSPGKNCCFAGTRVVSGSGKGIVTATGKKTTLGAITHLTVETSDDESGFSKDIARLSAFILRLVAITVVIVFALNIMIKGGEGTAIPALIIFSIALTVSVIPEALPLVMTFSFSRGALRLAKHHVVVKRLSAIEDLGSIDVLCTDKTGTLTENKLSVAAVYPHHHDAVITDAYLSSDETRHTHSSVHSFDSAIYDALSSEQKQTIGAVPRIHQNPFDPQRRRMSVVVQKDGEHILRVLSR